MFRILLVVFINMLLGAALNTLVIKLPEQTLVLIGAGILLALILTAWIMLSKKDAEIKQAEKEMKEGEVYYRLTACGAKEAGMGILALVRRNKDKKLKLLIFKTEPPPIFKMEGGKIVPHA